MVSPRTEYISVGGNRHPAAADWDRQSGLLAFGADNNVALWEPTDPSRYGISRLLLGHADKVNAVKFYTTRATKTKLLLTGSVDKTIRVWQADPSAPSGFKNIATLEGHEGSINCIAICEDASVFASGAADGTVRIWGVNEEDGVKCVLHESVTVTPRFFPLALALRALPSQSGSSAMVLAVGGTKNIVQVYAAQGSTGTDKYKLGATLTGHEAWIRSLTFTYADNVSSPDILLASASQDKYIRLWKLHAGEVAATRKEDDLLLGGFEATLSNKAHKFELAGSTYSITFEALLFGHEDWIYTTAWNPDPERLQLLSASADNSLCIWEQDPVSGVWISAARMGEISAQKGSTSATGSTGGFWIGLWSPNGTQVVSLGRTGSWRSWKYEAEADMWAQEIGISGHVRSVNGIQWDSDGGYLLSTGSDQTTRLHAKWLHDEFQSWHEFSRPQIHGYDLNCIDTLGPQRFISGADEKLLRVFQEPRSIAALLKKLCGVGQKTEEELPDTANVPVLGLSNKAAEEVNLDDDVNEAPEAPKPSESLLLDFNHPPLEDHLARRTLWPELEKLYGHGYEISAVAASHDRSVVATACKASSIDHAVIRLYDTTDWHEVKPPLTAHSLTITSLCFSQDDKFILSVGRDRQWAVFERAEGENTTYSLFTSNPKGHSRMILGSAWAPVSAGRVFATAGRDKSVKLWIQDGQSFTCNKTIPLSQPVTAISFLPNVLDGSLYLAVGLDNGDVSIHGVVVDGLEVGGSLAIPKPECPSKTITQLSWRPVRPEAEGQGFELAVASEDSSLRIYSLPDLPS